MDVWSFNPLANSCANCISCGLYIVLFMNFIMIIFLMGTIRSYVIIKIDPIVRSYIPGNQRNSAKKTQPCTRRGVFVFVFR